MQKIDRLGWADGGCFRSYGWTIGVRSNDSAILDRLKERLPPGWEPTEGPVVQHLYSFRVGGETKPGVRAYSLVYAGLGRIARTMDVDEALDVFESDLQITMPDLAGRGRSLARLLGGLGHPAPSQGIALDASLIPTLVETGVPDSPGGGCATARPRVVTLSALCATPSGDRRSARFTTSSIWREW
jgi:hypothetical protein